MTFPDFFIIGAQKSGTTALHHYLNEHPDIYLPEQKETKFFIDGKEYEKGLGYYEEKYFSGCENEKAVGEVDPDIMYFPEAIPRIKEHIDNPKFIIILRNPIERAFSHYLMTYRRGIEKHAFEDAIKLEEGRIKKGYFERMHFSYISRGFYYSQITTILEQIDRSQILYLTVEDLSNNTLDTIHRCCEFLGVSEDFEPANINKRYHEAEIPKTTKVFSLLKDDNSFYSSLRAIGRLVMPKLEWRREFRKKLLSWNLQPNKGKIVLSKEVRQLLSDTYREENKKLSELLGRDLGHWN